MCFIIEPRGEKPTENNGGESNGSIKDVSPLTCTEWGCMMIIVSTEVVYQAVCYLCGI